jgi:hypothetical protein
MGYRSAPSNVPARQTYVPMLLSSRSRTARFGIQRLNGMTVLPQSVEPPPACPSQQRPRGEGERDAPPFRKFHDPH